MIIVLGSLLLGIVLGSRVGSKMLRVNDRAFTVLSTVFVFIMGMSLALTRSAFSGVGNLLINSILLAVVASLGSIFFTLLLQRILSKKYD